MEFSTENSLVEKFFKEPTHENFSEFLSINTEESNGVEFKSSWIDFDKLSKIILGIANYGGGYIVIGLDEEHGVLNPKGIKEEDVVDPADFTKKIAKFLPKSILDNIQLKNISYCNEIYSNSHNLKNKIFQIIFIRVNHEDLPIICESDGKQIEKGAIYFRRGTSTEKINYDELQILIKNKIDAMISKIDNKTLKKELEQLKILNDEIPFSFKKGSFSNMKQNVLLNIMGEVENKIYPEKSFEQFLVDVINKKQKQIEKFLGV